MHPRLRVDSPNHLTAYNNHCVDRFQPRTCLWPHFPSPRVDKWALATRVPRRNLCFVRGAWRDPVLDANVRERPVRLPAECFCVEHGGSTTTT